MKTNFKTRAASLALLSTVLVSCGGTGKDNNLNGQSTSGSASTASSVSSLSTAPTNFSNVIANGKCDPSVASRKFFGVSISKSNGTPSAINVSSINNVSFTDAKNVMVGQAIKYVNNAQLDQFIFVKETSSSYELYQSLCLPTLAYSGATSIARYDYPSFPVLYSVANTCSYNVLAAFYPTITFNDGSYAYIQFSGYCVK